MSTIPGGDEAGSVASIGFVEDAVKATLEEVPKEQVIMGMPLYSRVWYYDGTTLKSSAMGVASHGKLYRGSQYDDDLG